MLSSLVISHLTIIINPHLQSIGLDEFIFEINCDRSLASRCYVKEIVMLRSSYGFVVSFLTL